MPNNLLSPEESLDPQDWEAFRDLAHHMLDDMLDYQQQVRQRPVWQPVPAEVKDFLKQPLPQEPQAHQQVYQDFVENVLPYPMGNIHPRFWGWVMGNGTPFAAMAELLAATMNPNMGGGDHGANYVEIQVLDWLKEMFGYPAEASGLLVSGASMANLVGLTVARNTLAGYDIRSKGLRGGPRQMVLYASEEVHSCVHKAAELLGLGREALRLIPVNADYEMDLEALERAIAADQEAGLQPFCVVGTSGTVNTGAIDDLQGIADICEREHLWFHVDGAIGAVAILAPEVHACVEGLQRSDSMALDLHKWMYMPFEAGCVLVRSEPAHRKAFSLTPEYLAHTERGLAAGPLWFSDYGLQLSRGFRALKVWMSLKEHGVRKFGRMVRQNMAQARYLAQQVEASPVLEVLAPVQLNIVCFRYNPGGLDQEELNRLNQELLIRLHESGIAVPSYTTLNGCYCLRAAITNHRSRREDFDLLVEATERLGSEVAAEILGAGTVNR
jgi:glutamate/tyrosine decarboxylase-like PLP-dependent enzyme